MAKLTRCIKWDTSYEKEVEKLFIDWYTACVTAGHFFGHRDLRKFHQEAKERAAKLGIDVSGKRLWRTYWMDNETS